MILGKLRDLNSYVDNAWVGEFAPQLVNEMGQRADFILNPHDYRVGLTLNTVDGSAPAYGAINKPTAELKALLVNKTPIDKAQLATMAAVWQEHLAKANWEDKKSEINKKVATALLGNLCAVALLSEEYTKLAEYTKEFAKHNSGMLNLVGNAFNNNTPSFEADPSYSGSNSAPQYATLFKRSTEKGKGVYYSELMADLEPDNK